MKITILRLAFISFISLSFFTVPGCAFKRISRSKNLPYLKANPSARTAEQQLSIFAPRKPATPKEVLVFIHGGDWNSGKKSLYSYFGSRMARKGVVFVIIDYPLGPAANYHGMATAAATAVQWVKNNIEKYGGNPEKIFVSGHSAGGQLAALIAVHRAYFDTLGVANPVKGCILIDAAGLDMHGYLKEEKLAAGHPYLKIFTSDPAVWKAASPLYHLHPGMPPLLIYRGGKTYPSIAKSTEKFVNALREFTAPNYHVLAGKKHVSMITQFFWSRNPLYGEMIEFMQKK